MRGQMKINSHEQRKGARRMKKLGKQNSRDGEERGKGETDRHILISGSFIPNPRASGEQKKEKISLNVGNIEDMALR